MAAILSFRKDDNRPKCTLLKGRLKLKLIPAFTAEAKAKKTMILNIHIMYQNNLIQNVTLVPNSNVSDFTLFQGILKKGYLISEILITQK